MAKTAIEMLRVIATGSMPTEQLAEAAEFLSEGTNRSSSRATAGRTSGFD